MIEMSSLTKRMIAMLAGVALFLAAIGAVKVHQIRTAVAQAASFQPPPEAVTTLVARQEVWPVTLKAIGSVAPVQGVMVSADLPGIVAEIAFDSGTSVRAGAPLVRLDTRQEQAQLAAAEAQRELARLNLDRIADLLPKGVISRAEYDRVSAEHKQAEARAGEIRATIERKQIRAPFSGMLGIRQVNLGQYLTGGAAVVQLQSLRPIYVNFAVPQQQVAPLRIGAEVRVSAEGLAGELSGRITAVDSVVDEGTRNVQVQSTLANSCWDDYIRQTFRGISCTYGDDRHLTNLVLAAGYDTLFVPGATAITNAPESLNGYLKQQLRWNKSFYRELLWTLPFLLRRSRYMVFEVIVQTLLPLLLTLAIATSLLFAILVDPGHLVHYALAITVMALVRCGYAIYRTRRLSFLLFVLYGFIHAALLVPLRMRALTTLTDNSWGTRTSVQRTTA